MQASSIFSPAASSATPRCFPIKAATYSIDATTVGSSSSASVMSSWEALESSPPLSPIILPSFSEETGLCHQQSSSATPSFVRLDSDDHREQQQQQQLQQFLIGLNASMNAATISQEGGLLGGSPTALRRASTNSAASVLKRNYSMQFYKTKLCPFHERGMCRSGSLCTYAHGEEELMEQPDLFKTKICTLWPKGLCNYINCR